MKAAISGQSGFLGSRLSTALLSKGFQLVRITQEHLYTPNKLRKLFLDEQPDYIFHLAAYGNMSTQKEPVRAVMSNILGTFNMLEESRTILYKAFINFGSSSEYGKTDHAMSERDRLSPQTFYGATKAAATHLAWAYAKQYDKPIVTVRPFSVYGPAEADYRFIPTVIRSMIKKEAFPLDTAANHDWIYIDDFIDAVILVANRIIQVPQGIVNIGSGHMHSNKEVCEFLKQITGLPYMGTVLEGMRRYDSPIWLSDNSLISSLGWYPKYMLKEGLTKTYEYYKKIYN